MPPLGRHEGEVRVFIKKDDQRKEVRVEKRVEKGNRAFCWSKTPQPPQNQEGRDDQPTPEQEAPAMDEVRPDEVQTEWAMWMAEKITVLQNENGGLEKPSKK